MYFNRGSFFIEFVIVSDENKKINLDLISNLNEVSFPENKQYLLNLFMVEFYLVFCFTIRNFLGDQ